MLRREFRLRDRRDVARVYQKGNSVRGHNVSLKYLPNQLERSRLAVVVSKKVTKSAPKRNRIRRRMYEAYRTLSPNVAIIPVDAILSVFSDEFSVMPAPELRQTMQNLLKKLPSVPLEKM
jgi:ribonuclease P protein component